MLTLPDSWVWDAWFADDGHRHHVFFLYASRALHDPEARHHRASVGHAVSDDLVSWTRVPDALVRGDHGDWDDLATWTGSVVQHPDGTWFMFYTGVTMTPRGPLQRVGVATSDDLVTWHKSSQNPVLEADARWYERLEAPPHDGAFRDPWVFPDPDGDGWHMLLTARSATGAFDDRGVVGHARSPDLRTWHAMPPLTEPGAGFGHLEVLQLVYVDDEPMLLFSCAPENLSAGRREATGGSGGVWCARADGALAPYDLRHAVPLTDMSLYSGRAVRRRDGRWAMLAFLNEGPDGRFVGSVADPLDLRRTGRTIAVAVPGPGRHRPGPDLDC